MGADLRLADVHANFPAALLGPEVGGIMRSMSFTVELPDSVPEALRLAPPDAEAEVL